MTQHPFDREFSEQEAAKLNAEQEAAAEQELTDNDLEEVAGGIVTAGVNEGGITGLLKEVGGPISNKFIEAGGLPTDKSS